MTELITPAKLHDNQYPVPLPTPTNNFSLAVLNKVNWLNDATAGGNIELPSGDCLVIVNPQVAAISNIQLSDTNFNHASGLGVIKISTAVNYEGASQNVAFTYRNNEPSFTKTFEANATYILIFALVNDGNAKELLLVNTQDIVIRE